jgi:peptide/nickel transport system permease protein
MTQYLIKRILLIIPTLIGAALLVFFLMRMVPGNVCEIRLIGEGMGVSEEELTLCRENLGLNRPVIVQFTDMFIGLVTFDLGTSMWTGRAITHELGLRFELTVQLALMTLVVSILIAIPLGVVSAVKRATPIDYLVRTFAIAGEAIPSFWLGLMIILGMLIGTQMVLGEPMMPPIIFVPFFVDPLNNLAILILPALATGYRSSAVITRMTRSAMLEILREDYVRTARSKGLAESIIRRRHALKNAMLPVMTLIGIEFAFLIGGLVVTEQVFNLNGLGQLFVDAVEQKDYTMVQAMVMLVVLTFAVTNLVIDVLYATLDPRIRYS